LGLIIIVFLGGLILNKKTNNVSNYVRKLLSVNRYETALKTLDNNP
jgi:hypothetical protein